MKGGFFISYTCPNCSNQDKRYFFKLNGKVYCRKCLKYRGETSDNTYKVNSGKFTLNYSLTEEQKKASNFLLNNVIKGKDCAINAVCGAGKTEIIYETIEYCLTNHLKVGLAIPRKDVVIELEKRISQDFNVNVVGVYGDHHQVIEGDIIIFTTHQAFRYKDYFDVLIIDEIDAFPYMNNETLKNIINKCSKTFVYMSATMPKYILKDPNIAMYYLNRRYHNHDLIVPSSVCSSFMVLKLKKYLKKFVNKVVLVYFPTIKIQMKISKKIKYNYLINSKVINRDYLLKKIKEMKSGVILTTTVLERGITIKDVQVIVYDASHSLFTKDTLIQIAGRVGRHKDYYKGEVIFISKYKNKSIKEAIKDIKKYNE